MWAFLCLDLWNCQGEWIGVWASVRALLDGQGSSLKTWRGGMKFGTSWKVCMAWPYDAICAYMWLVFLYRWRVAWILKASMAVRSVYEWHAGLWGHPRTGQIQLGRRPCLRRSVGQEPHARLGQVQMGRRPSLRGRRLEEIAFWSIF